MIKGIQITQAANDNPFKLILVIRQRKKMKLVVYVQKLNSQKTK